MNGAATMTARRRHAADPAAAPVSDFAAAATGALHPDEPAVAGRDPGPRPAWRHHRRAASASGGRCSGPTTSPPPAKNEETRVLAPVFEREAIRPHVFGRFDELLVASSLHPGMLAYLDQQQSVGPDSVQVQRAALRQVGRARQGLNENLGPRDHGAAHRRRRRRLHPGRRHRVRPRPHRLRHRPRATTTTAQIGQAVFRDSPPRARRAHGDGQALWRRRRDPGRRHPRRPRRPPADGAPPLHQDRRPLRRRHSPTPSWWRGWRRPGDARAATLPRWRRPWSRRPEAWAPQPMKLKTPYEFLISSYRALDKSPMNVQREVVRPADQPSASARSPRPSPTAGRTRRPPGPRRTPWSSA